MIYKNLKKTLLLLTFFSTLNAASFTSIGYGDSETESRKEALIDLSNQISVDVKSNYESRTSVIDNKYKKDKQNIVHLSSNLPLKGVTFRTYKEGNSFRTKATISLKKSGDTYLQELERLKRDIEDDYDLFKISKHNNNRYSILKNILSNMEMFNKNKLVASMLGVRSLPKIRISISSIKTRLLRIQKKVSSIQMASNVLTGNIRMNNIYLSPVKVHGSSEVTQFARVLKQNMASRLKTTRYPDKADYFIKGTYEILDGSIFVTINLYDRENNIIQTNTTNINKKGYEDLEYRAKTKSFDESMKNGFVKSGKLRVSIGFSGYSRDDGIDLSEGETVDIVVKSNKAMCYFLVGHTMKNNDTFSYLLPIGSENTPFINYITGDDVNHAVMIAEEVPIESPFGNEKLQIFANTLDKNGKCTISVPKCSENDEGYCVIGKKPTKVLSKTRALAFHKKKNVTEKAEGSISFTTFPY